MTENYRDNRKRKFVGIVLVGVLIGLFLSGGYYLFKNDANPDKVLNAQNNNTKIEINAMCKKASQLSIPQTDLPAEADISKYKSDSIECVIYRDGIGVKQDYEQYRTCVLAKEHPDSRELMEIYANGWGVKRNPELALHYACKEGSPQLLHDLNETKNLATLPDPIFYCGYQVTTLDDIDCAYKSFSVQQLKQEKQYALHVLNWPDRHQKLMIDLRSKADVFFKEHSDEKGICGTMHPGVAIRNIENMSSWLFNTIVSLEEGKLVIVPYRSDVILHRIDKEDMLRCDEGGLLYAARDIRKDADYDKVDQELNAKYRQIMGFQINDLDDSCENFKPLLRQSQRKWLAFRDAFSSFATSRYPNINKIFWNTWLTRIRTNELIEWQCLLGTY